MDNSKNKDKPELNDDAKEALDIIDFLKKNGGTEEYRKYKKAKTFIKETGTVSPLFLANLRERKKELQNKL